MGEPFSFGWVEVVVWTLGALLLMALVIGFAQGARPDITSDMVTLSGTSSAVFLTLSAVLLGRYSNSSSVLGALGLRRIPVLTVLLSLVAGVLLQFPALALARLTERYFPIPEAELLERTAALRGASPTHALLLAVFLALVVPFSEEAFFRGALFGAVRRGGHSSRFASVSTGTVFVLSHLDPHYWPALALVAAFLSALRGVSGSLVPSLVFHMGFNGYTVAMTTYGLGGSGGELAIPGHIEMGLLAASVVLSTLLLGYLSKSRRCAQFRELENGDASAA
jgi:membrane protease YdiL (CAAX protease family)